jgi:hypothetical protein
VKDPFITLAIVSVLILACGEEEGVTKPAPERLEPTTPAYVLRNVEIAFNQRDINLLKAMLSKDFVFHFDPRDVGGSPPGKPEYKIPASWLYNQFWPAASNIFKYASGVNCSIATSRVGAPSENETGYRAEYINISFLVMIDSLNGYIAQQGYCNFEFERYEAASGKKYWRLINWWDRTSQGYDANPGVEAASLGKVLALFR